MSNYYAVLSGSCASAASLFGKLTGLPIFEDYILLRIIFFALMILCNAGVWTLFVRALQASQSSLTPTLISAASNYLFSALMGFFIFKEITSTLWWAGTSLVLIGLVLISSDQTVDLDEVKHQNKAK